MSQVAQKLKTVFFIKSLTRKGEMPQGKMSEIFQLRTVFCKGNRMDNILLKWIYVKRLYSRKILDRIQWNISGQKYFNSWVVDCFHQVDIQQIVTCV